MTVCSKCQNDNPAGKDFCSNCGDFLGWDTDSPPLGLSADESAAVASAGSDGPPGPPVAVAPADPNARRADDEARRARVEARRVRVESTNRARQESEDAKRRAVVEVRGQRAEALARADSVVEAARRTSGLSAPALAQLVAEVEKDATAQARHEAEVAELRAARRARRERDEAYRRARTEAAEAEERANELARRAAALVARPAPPTVASAGIPAAAGPVTTTLDPPATRPADPASPPPNVRPAPVIPSVGPVLPGEAARPVRPPPPAPPPPTIRAGDTACWSCQSGNAPSRRFCQRCGSSLVEIHGPSPLTRWQRLRRWLARRRFDPRAAPDRMTAGGRGGPSLSGLRLMSKVRSVLAVVAVVVVVASLGPYRKQAATTVTRIRQQAIPRPSYIGGLQAVTGSSQSPAPELVNKKIDGREFTSTVLGGAPAPPLFSVDLDRPANLFKVGVIVGVLGENPPMHPNPYHVLLVAYGADHQRKSVKTMTLADTTAFQSAMFAVRNVSSVAFYVIDTYRGPGRTGPYTIDQVELFALT